MDAKGIVVVGLGNSYRRDDGVGVAAAAAIDDLALPHVRVVTSVVDSLSLLEAWSDAELAVVIDAAVVTPSTPGRVRRYTAGDVVDSVEELSSHSVDVGRTRALGQVLGRVPDALVLFTIEVADTDHGTVLTPQVAAAVPKVVGMAVTEIKGY
ncbi:hydrogenase maturation protease [Mycobacterium sp.]|uniref:hydrogenase maturation protease n=1 Tax=Mycobacterium sp. TaxID=1785 RepID=UPI003BAF5AB6